MSAPEFRVERNARGEMVICTYEGEEGRARVFSAGMLEACQRAELQARGKVETRDGPAIPNG